MDTRVLTAAGLDHKSAKVYLAALGLGVTNVQDIALKSGLKRPTVYLHIDELIKRGLFEKITVNKKRYYRAVDPRVIESQLKRSLDTLQKALPEFDALLSKTPGMPRVAVYESEEGIRAMYREMKNANSFRVWSDVGPSYPRFHDAYMELAEIANKNSINTREIIADTKEARRYARLIAKVAGPSYSARTATADGLANDAFVYGDTVLLFRLSEHNMFVVRIEDKQIANSMKALFDMAWKSGKALRYTRST
jgi:sugar-specific transcriptional regulator TrmB